MDTLATPTTSARQPNARVIWLRWVLAHLLVLSPAFYIAVRLFSDPDSKPFTCFVGPMSLFAVYLAEWISTRNLLHPPGENGFWVLVSVGGFVLAAMHLVVYPYITDSPSSASPLAIVVFGTVIGAAQTIVLQRHVPAACRTIRETEICISHAYWWIPANIVGAAAGAFAAWLINDTFLPLCKPTATSSSLSCENMTSLLAFVVGIALCSIVTGAALVCLLRRGNVENPFFSRPSDTPSPVILVLAEGLLLVYTFFLR